MMFSRTTVIPIMLAPLLGCAGQLAPHVVSAEHTFEPDDVEQLHVRLSVGAGLLEVHGGDCGFARATLRYDERITRPRVEYQRRDGHGWLSIEDEDLEIRRRDDPHRVELCLGPDVPTSVELDLGAGATHLDARGIELTRLRVDAGVGELNLDLSSLRHDTEVHVDAGIGEVDILVPPDFGVDLTIDRGLGSLELPGFEQIDEDRWRRDAASSDTPRLALEVDAGVGEVRVASATG